MSPSYCVPIGSLHWVLQFSIGSVKVTVQGCALLCWSAVLLIACSLLDACLVSFLFIDSLFRLYGEMAEPKVEMQFNDGKIKIENIQVKFITILLTKDNYLDLLSLLLALQAKESIIT